MRLYIHWCTLQVIKKTLFSSRPIFVDIATKNRTKSLGKLIHRQVNTLDCYFFPCYGTFYRILSIHPQPDDAKNVAQKTKSVWICRIRLEKLLNCMKLFLRLLRLFQFSHFVCSDWMCGTKEKEKSKFYKKSKQFNIEKLYILFFVSLGIEKRIAHPVKFVLWKQFGFRENRFIHLFICCSAILWLLNET